MGVNNQGYMHYLIILSQKWIHLHIGYSFQDIDYYQLKGTIVDWIPIERDSSHTFASTIFLTFKLRVTFKLVILSHEQAWSRFTDFHE